MYSCEDTPDVPLPKASKVQVKKEVRYLLRFKYWLALTDSLPLAVDIFYRLSLFIELVYMQLSHEELREISLYFFDNAFQFFNMFLF